MKYMLLFAGIIVIVIALYLNYRKEEVHSDLMLENIEALALQEPDPHRGRVAHKVESWKDMSFKIGVHDMYFGTCEKEYNHKGNNKPDTCIVWLDK